ncbi:response regulator transcription factor [Anaeromicropila herbilytica]|uniref:Stage 0 sporulation protein A homolog n=1 Tax=Anaeromicropila herbilytica TaxID=2785025 RepID=A0A7R7EMM3_9FIRM|nr:response regulator transcription factor [Anaeromicropila herbilytica]BCN31665.1 DNA-binding response regulator [Anaeromicropila herbilytica]
MVDILLVEDNKELSNLMSKFLVKDGYTVCCAMSGEEAEDFLLKDKARLIILDIMLPGIDGFAVCSYIRQKGDIPIIIISAMVDKESKMNGFQLGADDYIEKPVDIDILRAKIAALFKRFYDVHESAALLRSGDIVIDQDSMQVTYKGKELNLTIKEYDLLLLLIENKGKTMNKEYLFNEIWGANSFSENQTLTVHIKMLRDKIEEDSRNPMRIKTVWGVGYRYEEI